MSDNDVASEDLGTEEENVENKKETPVLDSIEAVVEPLHYPLMVDQIQSTAQAAAEASVAKNPLADIFDGAGKFFSESGENVGSFLSDTGENIGKVVEAIAEGLDGLS